MFKSYLKVAFRNLSKKKLFTLINITGLVISMVVALLILNYVSFEKSYDSIHKKGDRIYRVENKFFEGENLTDYWATASFGYASAMKENIPGIEDFTRIAINATEQMVSYGEQKARENTVVAAEPSLFTVFSFKLIKGDKTTALSSPNKVVISQLAAYKYLKDENPIGKVLKFKTINRTIECEVSGILENIPANSHINYDFFISWETQPDWIRDFWYLHETYSYVLLQAGVSPESIEQAFPQMAEKYKTREALKNKTWAIQLKPLNEIHLSTQLQYEREAKGNAKAINALILIALAILLIAWINYINLTTSRSLERAREVGVRKALGASNSSLFYSLSREFIYLTLYSAILGIPLAFFIMNEWISSYAFQTDIKWWFFVLPVLVLIVIATLTISYQTLKTAHSSAIESLKYE